MAKTRNQKIAAGDTVDLRFYTINNNTPTNVYSLEKVEIYYLDPTFRTEVNPDGRRLVETIQAISHDDVGLYSVEVVASDPTYVIGSYLDVWYVQFEESDDATTREQSWKIQGDTWYSHSEPLVHGFRFVVRPTQMRQGEIKPLLIAIIPEVPNNAQFDVYYRLVEASGVLSLTIEQVCGECLPAERDLRLVIEDEVVDQKIGNRWTYQLDTTDLSIGVYYLKFKLEVGGNVYFSDNLPLAIAQ